MEQAKVTFKGQITIPKAVRQALDIQAGDSVVFQIAGDHALIKPLRKRNLLDFYGIFPTDRPSSGIEAERKEAHNQIAEKCLGDTKV